MFKELIWVKENSLSNVFCNHLIDKFEKDPNKQDGMVNTLKPRLDKKVKITKEATISQSLDWKEEDKILYKALSFSLEEYSTSLVDIGNNILLAKFNSDDGRKLHPANGYDIRDTGYKVQKYEPNCFYNWHHEWDMDRGWARMFTYIWYLNTIDEKDGGWTEFVDGTKIQPKTGSILFFPATWTYVHRGYTTKVPKYIVTGWIYAQPTE